MTELTLTNLTRPEDVLDAAIAAPNGVRLTFRNAAQRNAYRMRLVRAVKRASAGPEGSLWDDVVMRYDKDAAQANVLVLSRSGEAADFGIVKAEAF